MNLLRPEQQKEMHEERDSLVAKMNNPHIQDKASVSRQLRNLETQLESQTPVPYRGQDLDTAVSRESQLREEILNGMPSQEEMRKSPPGAVGKHIAWEKANKEKLLKWKEIRLRLNTGSSDPDIANFERFRPKTSSLSMDNAAIPGQKYFMPPNTQAYNEGYEKVFGEVSQKIETHDEVLPKKKKHTLSDEQKEKLRARMKAFHEKRRMLKADATKNAPEV